MIGSETRQAGNDRTVMRKIWPSRRVMFLVPGLAAYVPDIAPWMVDYYG